MLTEFEKAMDSLIENKNNNCIERSSGYLKINNEYGFTVKYQYDEELSKKVKQYDDKLFAFKLRLSTEVHPEILSYCALYPIEHTLGNFLFYNTQIRGQELLITKEILDKNYHRVCHLSQTNDKELLKIESEITKKLVCGIKELEEFRLLFLMGEIKIGG
jgi:hypothetical protein